MTPRRFAAFERAGREPGVRNRVLVLPSVICSHAVADRIAAAVPGAESAAHDHGCAQIGADNDQTRRAFLGVGANPNVAGAVVVGLGCEVLQSDDVAASMADLGVPVRELSIQGAGGTEACVERGVEAARDLVADARGSGRRDAGLSDLTLGIVGSDLRAPTTDVAEPLVGEFAREVVKAGGRVVVAGVERLSAHPEGALSLAASPGAREDLRELLERHRGVPARSARVRAAAEDRPLDELVRAWGGLPVEAALDYGERAGHDSGLAVLDAPSGFEEAATGLAAAGCQLVVHATADGVPTGHPVVPVVKVSGDPETVSALPDDIDVDATTASAVDLASAVVSTAGGEPACAERHGLSAFAITRVGPSM